MVFKADRQDYELVMTYGLHCFTKADSGKNIPYWYKDDRHRLLRIRVTSTYFARTGEGSPETSINKKGSVSTGS